MFECFGKCRKLSKIVENCTENGSGTMVHEFRAKGPNESDVCISKFYVFFVWFSNAFFLFLLFSVSQITLYFTLCRECVVNWLWTFANTRFLCLYSWAKTHSWKPSNLNRSKLSWQILFELTWYQQNIKVLFGITRSKSASSVFFFNCWFYTNFMGFYGLNKFNSSKCSSKCREHVFSKAVLVETQSF